MDKRGEKPEIFIISGFLSSTSRDVFASYYSFYLVLRIFIMSREAY